MKTEFDELYSAVFSNADKYIEIVRLLFANKQGLTFDEVSKKTGMNGQRLTTVLRNLERCGFMNSFPSHKSVFRVFSKEFDFRTRCVQRTIFTNSQII